jgi:hypothetical protein
MQSHSIEPYADARGGTERILRKKIAPRGTRGVKGGMDMGYRAWFRTPANLPHGLP